MLKTLPNILTFSRILAIPVVIGLLLFINDPVGSWLAFSAYTYACLTDFLDGYLARAWHQQSAFGRFLDPIADKLLISSVLLVLVGIDRLSNSSVLPAAIILCREILVSGLREFLAELQISVPVTKLAKWKTTIQMLALGFLLVGPNGPAFWSLSTIEIGLYGLWIAAGVTLITGFDYLLVGIRYISETDHAPAGRRITPTENHRSPGTEKDF
jgi:cardiolipin synthase